MGFNSGFKGLNYMLTFMYYRICSDDCSVSCKVVLATEQQTA